VIIHFSYYLRFIIIDISIDKYKGGGCRQALSKTFTLKNIKKQNKLHLVGGVSFPIWGGLYPPPRDQFKNTTDPECTLIKQGYSKIPYRIHTETRRYLAWRIIIHFLRMRVMSKLSIFTLKWLNDICISICSSWYSVNVGSHITVFIVYDTYPVQPSWYRLSVSFRQVDDERRQNDGKHNDRHIERVIDSFYKTQYITM